MEAIMDSSTAAPNEQFDPPVRLFERLRQIAGYAWDETKPPFHSSYDNWHVFGTRFVSPFHLTSTPSPHQALQNATSPIPPTKLASSRTSPAELTPRSEPGSERSSPAVPTSQTSNVAVVEEAIVARLSYHVLREERAFHIAKSLIASADPSGEHIVKPLDLIRLAPSPGDKGPIVVAIYQYPGPNRLVKLLDFGPAFFWARKDGEKLEADQKRDFELDPPISLQQFLDFAIGATKCLEIIHHGQGIVHGEIRGDAFHFNVETNKVKLLSFGSGIRSFEHGLTSTGWSTLSKELGAKNKLLYISPEQTGRMPAEPDTRTDIYSLGVVLWTLLTRQPVFSGETPLDIVQGVLGRRIPNVSAVRLDIPDVVGRIIQKCTEKNVNERYHSVSGLRHDLLQVQEFLGRGDWLALSEWQIGSKDVSSFFMLPNVMIGRNREKTELLKVIDRVVKSHALHQLRGVNRYSDGSSLSNELVLDAADNLSSEGASSNDGATRRSGSFTHTIPSDPTVRSIIHPPTFGLDSATVSGETVSSGRSGGSGLVRLARPWDRHQSISFDTRSLADSGEQGSRHSGAFDSSSSLSRHLGSAKFRRRGHCEVVTIEGAGGLGKSCLVQSVLAEARRKGYCATAKFDTARRTAYGPLLKLLSSLFRQVWGERNTETPFHQALKQYVRPAWPMLHKILGLPEFLLGPVEESAPRPLSSVQSIASNSLTATRSLRMGRKRRGSSPDTSPRSPAASKKSAPSAFQDFSQPASSMISIRFMDMFLDVLRMFTNHKFICFCLDDLHFADDESLELITQIIGARLRMLVICTYRPEEMSREKVQEILQLSESEESRRGSSPKITNITLSPLSEDDIVQYVSTTLCRPPEDVTSLALVIQSKTAGNPFYMREMLSDCFRKKCIWYDYRDSQWHFDLDRLFEQFQGEQNYDVLDTDFLTRRLNEMPPATRAILAWGALLGHTFSFELVCRLLEGEFLYVDELCPQPHNRHYHSAYSQPDAVAALQVAIQACVVVPSDRDDRFRFSHDRYMQAAAALGECNPKKMHYAIAQTLLKYYCSDDKSKDSAAAHICESIDIIKRRVRNRKQFRQVLADCAQAAAESGARSTAAKYYSNAIALLQPDPWTDGPEDVSYNETIQLYLRLAECHLYMGQHTSAGRQLQIIFASARTELDKAPAWVLQSRIHAQKGDSRQTLNALKTCLKALGINVDEHPTWEKCDAEFERLSILIQTQDRAQILDPPRQDNASHLSSLGGVFAEAVSAGWWSDCTAFYHLTLLMLNHHLTTGAFPQSGTAFMYTAMIAVSRFNMIQFAVDLGSIALELLQGPQDPYSMAKGYLIYATFVSHVQIPLALAVNHMEGGIEYAAAAGDRITTILGYGLAAQLKFFASEHLADLEAFCQYSCDEIPNWHLDTRGGPGLIAVRQICRALQGKTRAQNALEVMTDDQHDSEAYKAWLKGGMHDGDRPLLFYETLELVPLFLFGHYERAIELGKICYDTGRRVWSIRNTRLAMLFYGLSLAGTVLRRQQDPRPLEENFDNRVKETIAQVEELNKKIKDWQIVNNINYLCWSKLLDAQISEMSGNQGSAIQRYEEALDHASEHNFLFEEALGNYLMANIFIRHSARRSARSALKDAVSLYRQLGAFGVADRIEFEHSLLLHGPVRNPRSMDAGVQTDFDGDVVRVQFRTGDAGTGGDDQPPQAHVPDQLKNDQIGVWRGAFKAEAPGVGLPSLDMIDLHAILVSSQVISSVLRVEELLKTMCDVILQTCGGSATLAAIIVQDEDSSKWCVAASGDPERGAEAHVPGISLSETSLVAENVILYCTRFREVVFLPDLVNDERFGNVSDVWLQKNPLSKAVIALPISHGSKPLLGVLYLEGVSGSFTDRNVSVLQLLVNQIGISYSNALAMKAVEKVSAENLSMVALQKRALAKAIEAETKAKDAEAEAKRNVKLAEEATKAKSIFLANVSHELRTPLNGVIGNSELLRESELNKEQLELADSIRISADLLLTVINDILDFSRMEADKMKLFVIAFNPEEMVREVVRAVSYSNREKTSKKNVVIIQDIKLPPILIYGDPIRLHQVLGNLIGNSLKFTDHGSITIGARVDSQTADSATLTFWVRDTGIGIPPKQLAKLFQPFSQADASTARKYGGSGLGLSICRSLIETMMKGRIELDSQENVGTTAWFTVTFERARPEVMAGDAPANSTANPAVQAAQESLLQSVSPGSSSSSTPSPHDMREPPSPNPYTDISQIPKDRLRICIAEDNAINQKIAVQYMHRLGYPRVDAYDNGLMAVEGLRQKARAGEPYHICLMDVQMPVLDGYEATKMIRKDPLEAVRKVLIIAMTASAIQGDREKCLAAGMNDYLAKPVRSEVLKRKLDTYIIPQRAPDRTLGSTRSAPETGQSTPTAASTPRPEREVNGAATPATNMPIREGATTRSSSSSISSAVPLAPSRTSSDTPSLEGGASLAAAVSAASATTTSTTASAMAAGETPPPAKRQPKKLTKRNSEAAQLLLVQSPSTSALAAHVQAQSQQGYGGGKNQAQDQREKEREKERGPPERAKAGVLQKRNSLRPANAGSPAAAEDARSSSNNASSGSAPFNKE